MSTISGFIVDDMNWRAWRDTLDFLETLESASFSGFANIDVLSRFDRLSVLYDGHSATNIIHQYLNQNK